MSSMSTRLTRSDKRVYAPIPVLDADFVRDDCHPAIFEMITFRKQLSVE
jgi:hypothetical protein